MHSADWVERRIWLFAGLVVVGIVGVIVLALLPNPKMPSTRGEHTVGPLSGESSESGVVMGPEELMREAQDRQREATERHDAAQERARRAVEELENGP